MPRITIEPRVSYVNFSIEDKDFAKAYAKVKQSGGDDYESFGIKILPGGHSGFGGSGTTNYEFNGIKYRVERFANGKTFWGTDHIIFRMKESISEIILNEDIYEILWDSGRHGHKVILSTTSESEAEDFWNKKVDMMKRGVTNLYYFHKNGKPYKNYHHLERKVVYEINEAKIETTIIDLSLLNEGMFSTFLSAIGGWLLGKASQKTVIKGQKDQIDILKNYLISMKKNQKEKDELINKLLAVKANSRDINDMISQFKDITGISLPS